MRSDRFNWNNLFQEVKEYVRPDAGDFTTHVLPGSRRTDRIFDGTAIYSASMLANGLQTFLCNPRDRWFNFSLHPQFEKLMDDDDVLTYLEQVTDIVYFMYALDQSNHKQSVHECFMDQATFGTGGIYQDFDIGRRVLSFQSLSLSNFFIDENNAGLVDTLYREMRLTARQVEQEFGKLTPPKIMKMLTSKTDSSKILNIVQAIYPRTDYDPLKVDSQNKPVASVWVCVETAEFIKEGGYDEMPGHVPRWAKTPGEIYGRSPAMLCLPDIKMLNSMQKTLIKMAEKQCDPPWIFESEGFLSPINSSPNAIMYAEPGTEKPYPLMSQGNTGLSLELMNQQRDQISKCFYVDWLKTPKESIQQTASEYVGRREENLSLMGPMLGRQEAEFLGPMLKRSYKLLSRNKMLPPVPQKLKGARLDIQYISPAARAQLSLKWMAQTRWIQELIPLAQIDPSILDVVDTDEYARQQAEMQDVTRKIVRTPRDIAAMRQSRQQQQQMQMIANTAQPAAGAVKDLAQARKFSSQAAGQPISQ